MSSLLASISSRSREVAKKANKLLERTRENLITLRYPSSLKMDEAVVTSFSDASFGDREDQSSQSGYLLCLANPEIVSGKEADVAIMEWRPHKVRRVCRSTLSAEPQGACIAAEAGDFMEIVMSEAEHKKLFSAPIPPRFATSTWDVGTERQERLWLFADGRRTSATR